MPQGKSNKAGKRPARRPVPGRPTPAPARQPAASGSTAAGRQSVAAARLTTPSSNRTQLRIGVVAVALIAIVLVVGLVLNKKQGAAPVTDHPLSTSSTASVTDGVVTVTAGKAKVTIDLFEDGICSGCRQFEAQYGQQITKAVDEGKLTVRYHFLNFLNPQSASKDYSTRAAAALECVAAVPPAQAPKGLFLNFHTTMFAAGTQPAEGGSADLSNTDIAALAVKAGAPQSAVSCITSGATLARAKATAEAGAALLAKAVGSDAWGTPAVMKDGVLLNIDSTDWLTTVLT